MEPNKGTPSGMNKSESPGLRDNESIAADSQNPNVEANINTSGDQIPGDVREINPNRNEDKTDATNAGGYKN